MGAISGGTRRLDFDLRATRLPTRDGEVLEFTHPEAKASSAQFARDRRVVFVNGMATSPQGHAESAPALSLVQMCTVQGVYNMTSGFVADLAQCAGDKWQFDGPLSPSARTVAAIGPLLSGRDREQSVRTALQRNPASLAMFEVMQRSRGRPIDVFAHSQGNLVLSNALQALVAVDGARAIAGLTVHSFGSPAANWPKGLRRREHAFTWDPVTWLAGIDTSLSISKVGMPVDSLQPVTHAFLEYMKADPALVVNRFRVGALGVTFRMDERGLAHCIVAMGANTSRVRRVFEHLSSHHASDADDVAEAYVEGVRVAADRLAIEAGLRSDEILLALLIRVLGSGWTTAGESRGIAYLKSLSRLR
ncbi:MAG: hypothetical protein JNK78_20555 [Planctomycetes bacterium]|nr:hypothetical protein [Planctomycetota bacterium]